MQVLDDKPGHLPKLVFPAHVVADQYRERALARVVQLESKPGALVILKKGKKQQCYRVAATVAVIKAACALPSSPMVLRLQMRLFSPDMLTVME